MKAMTVQQLRRRCWTRIAISVVLLSGLLYLLGTWSITWYLPGGKRELILYRCHIAIVTPTLSNRWVALDNEKVLAWKHPFSLRLTSKLWQRGPHGAWAVVAPVWPAFAIALPGSIAWHIRVYRREVRIKFERCVKCGYDTTGLSRCPECGASKA
jgi:hypothetical protein